MSNTEVTIPKWREDFPFETEADEFVSRRDFLRFLTLVSAGLAVGSGVVYVKSLEEEGPFPEVPVVGAGEMRPGSWRVFNYPDDKTPAIIIRRENGEYIAFHQKCPHLHCPVTYHPSTEDASEQIRCHCHNGRFDVDTGQGTHGPPRDLRPLRQVILKEIQDTIYAVGLNEIHFRR